MHYLPSNRQYWIFATLSALTLGSGICWSYLYQQHKQTLVRLDQARLAHEKALGREQVLDKELNELDQLIAELQRRKSQSEQQVENLEHRLASQQNRLLSLEGIAQVKLSLDQEAQELRLQRDQLGQEIEAGRTQNQTLAQALQAALDKSHLLAQELAQEKIRPQQELAMTASERLHPQTDRFMVRAMRGKAPLLTIKAARTHTLLISCAIDKPFDPETQPLALVLVYPNGRAATYASHQFQTVMKTRPEKQGLEQDLVLTLHPEQKLDPGMYRVQLFAGDRMTGRVEFSLR